ncbi:MAG TPA: hypothetical protein VFT84_01050, partial [Gemmatimonadales bacterium]|nr:hypothetical protein [Gemmatimonadales bacterium]
MPATPALRRGLLYDPVLAREHLIGADPPLGRLIGRVGEYRLELRHTRSLFASLARAIVYQQLSGAAAATILGRVVALFAPRRFPTPADILEIPPERLRAAGLSAAKTAALRDLAARTLDGTVPPMARVRRMDDEAVVAQLT